ncbi:MAG TPA: methyltransferase domain-containing protein [Steroidobacteraceae bacterium]
MEREAELAIVRRAYAKQILAEARVQDPRIRAAFAHVPREDFLGPGPWQIMRAPGVYTPTPEADPVYVYTNQLVGILPDRAINNGQPSLHAMLLAAVGISEGEHVVHVGSGTGYYTAIMSDLAGSKGRVTAIECDPELALRARQNLSTFRNVRVIHGNGAAGSFDAADVIYVNAGVTHPAEAWLDGLTDGGRLLLPLTTDENIPSMKRIASAPAMAMRTGAYFRIRRRGTTFEARWLLPVALIPAEGVRQKRAEAALAAAFAVEGGQSVTRLVRGETVPQEKCWLRGEGWSLVGD